MRILKLEKNICIASFLIIWVLLAMHGSGPIFSDELMYVDTGLRNYANPSYGNRYFHIYLQKLFMVLAPNPLTGVKIFWGFLVALTSLLIYWNARSFFKHSRPLHGLLAVMIFFSYQFVAEYCGVTSVDITAMTMVTIFLTLYLYILRVGFKQTWLLIALGAASFLSFKTKETTLLANVLLIGFFFDDKGEFSYKNFLPVIKPFIIGVAGAIGLFVVLDTLILHQPFFAISPATLAAIFENYAYQGGFRKEPSSYYTTYLLKDLITPFLLYLISGFKSYKNDDSPPKKIVWLFPLLLVIFMTFNMLKIPWGFIERFYFPALPIIAILAPQFLDSEWPKTGKEHIKLAIMLIGGAGLVLVLRLIFANYATHIAWDYNSFMDSIFYPAVLSLLLGTIILIKKLTWLKSVLPILCIFALLLSPLMYTGKYIFRTSFTGEIFKKEYHPFIAFKERIQFTPEMMMVCSLNLSQDLGMLSDNRDEIAAMFNIFFNERSSRLNFVLREGGDLLTEEIISLPFNYVLMTQSDWQLILADPARNAMVQSMYQELADPNEQVVLLTTR